MVVKSLHFRAFFVYKDSSAAGGYPDLPLGEKSSGNKEKSFR